MYERKLTAKIIVIGDLGVGKSTLTNNYVNGRTSVQQPMTVTPDLKTKEI